MKRPWTRRKASADIEAELRAHRPEPRPEIVRAIAAHVKGMRPQSRRTTRLAFAGALVAVVAFAAVGGIGSAGSDRDTKVDAAAEATSVTTTEGTGRHVATGQAEPTQPAAHPPTAEGCGSAVRAPRRDEQERRIRRTEEFRAERAACQPGQPSQDGK
jgi:hypothetical protein